jgi:hypothetical protein
MTVFRIRIHTMLIRIQAFLVNADPDPAFKMNADPDKIKRSRYQIFSKIKIKLYILSKIKSPLNICMLISLFHTFKDYGPGYRYWYISVVWLRLSLHFNFFHPFWISGPHSEYGSGSRRQLNADPMRIRI